jgi:phosphoglycolate phosphatase
MGGEVLTKAILFDMDNTILQSNIDFHKMCEGVFQLFCEHGILTASYPIKHQTASQIIEDGRTHPKFIDIEYTMWKLIEEVEAEGMEQVTLEPNAGELLAELKLRCIKLFVLTNNASRAAEKALKSLEVLGLFEEVVCREHMSELKPSASGILYVLNKYPSIPKREWLLVGDSWIDGMAATRAEIPFLSYKGDISMLRAQGVKCIGKIEQLNEILSWI